MNKRPFILLLILLIFLPISNFGQNRFPVRLEKKWGLISQNGQMLVSNVYTAIGQYNKFGFAIAQKNNLLGLLDSNGEPVFPAQFEDLKMLDETLVFVEQAGKKMILETTGKLILSEPFDRVELMDNGLIKFKYGLLWGLCSRDGSVLLQPTFHDIQNAKFDFVATYFDNKKGLIDINGTEIIPTSIDEFLIIDQDLILFQESKKWGAYNQKGQQIVPAQFDTFEKVNNNFLKFIFQNRLYLFSKKAERIITNGEFENYYPFSSTKVMLKKDRRLGIMDAYGKQLISTNYTEVYSCGESHFRAIKNDLWGLLNENEEILLDFKYNYISPPKNRVVKLRKGSQHGMANLEGKILLEAEFDKITIDNKQVRAFKGASLQLFSLQDDFNLKKETSFKKHFTINIGGKRNRKVTFNEYFEEENFMLDDFEWFYSVREDRWGLRRLDDGSIQIKPTFDNIQIEKEYGFTLVGLEQQGHYDFEWTKFRFGMVYGLVNNEKGLLISKVEFWDVKFEDFKAGLPLARVVFSNGTHGLINKKGKVIKRDFAFIDQFKNGMTRVSAKGKLSGNFKKKNKGLGNLNEYLEGLRSPFHMVDYTLYDQRFMMEAVLTCEDCHWGFLDTTGNMVIQEQYSFVRPFSNDVAIVQLNNKWGLVDKIGNQLMPCTYDKLRFLENTGETILQVSLYREKFGLIDTFGQVTVDLFYDEIGAFSEKRLAVKRNGLWGFVDQNGNEIIPCKYRRIKNFSDGLAAVQYKRKWGFIDKTGNTIIPFQYSQLGNFSEGLATASIKSHIGYLNQKGQFLIPPQFNKAFDFERGVARVVIKGKYALINSQGTYVLKPIYSNISEFNEHGLAKVRMGTKRTLYGLINHQGQLLTTKNYQDIGEFSEGLVVAKFKDKFGYLDSKGNLAISNRYSKAMPFSAGRAVIKEDGLCGYINVQGEKVINPVYTKCLPFEKDRAVVYKGYKQGGIIDTLGNYIIEPSINRLLDFSDGRGLVREHEYRFYFITESNALHEGFYENAGAFKHGVALVQSNGRWGIINQKGIPIIAPKYDKIEDFENGYAKVRIKEFIGLSNLKGEAIVPPNYEYISYAGTGLFRLEQGDKIGYINTSGKWIWALAE